MEHKTYNLSNKMQKIFNNLGSNIIAIAVFALLIFTFTFALPFASAQTAVPSSTGCTNIDTQGYCLEFPLPEPFTGQPITRLQGPAQFIALAYKYGLWIVGAAAAIMITIAGVKYLVSPVISSKEDAKKQIWAALTGLFLLLASYLILYTINPDLVNLSDPRFQGIVVPPQAQTGGTTSTSPTPFPYSASCETAIAGVQNKTLTLTWDALNPTQNVNCLIPGACGTVTLPTSFPADGNSFSFKTDWTLMDLTSSQIPSIQNFCGGASVAVNIRQKNQATGEDKVISDALVSLQQETTADSALKIFHGSGGWGGQLDCNTNGQRFFVYATLRDGTVLDGSKGQITVSCVK